MAHSGLQKNRERFYCSICLELLINPVTTPCQHNYCMSCIKKFWDEEDQRRIYSCPQCCQTFRPRPPLAINTMLAEVVQDLEKAGKDQEVICSRHNEVMEMFCRDDQRCICIICAKCEHGSHSVVPAAVARTEMQKELETKQLRIHQQISNKDRDLQVLEIELEKTFQSADKAAKDCDHVFVELLNLIKKRHGEVQQEIRSNLETEVVRVQRVQDKLEEEMLGLKRKEAEMGKLFVYRSDSQFLEDFPSVAEINATNELPRIKTQPRTCFETVAATVSKTKDKIREILYENGAKEMQPLKTEPSSRAQLTQFACHVTLDPATMNAQLALSEDDRRATLMREETTYPNHPDRFRRWRQVLSKECLRDGGRSYFEVEWRKKRVTVAVAYKDVARVGPMTDVAFGFNDKSWALECNTSSSYKFIHKAVKTAISGPWTSRIGVYLDHGEGVLAFYSVSDTVTLLHKVQTVFTRPLYAGLWFGGYQGAYAEFCELGEDDH
ncbi:tripartite motif-containing protein 16-like [Eucyclogobius newberryi]|uniref:tripartite motif-containing protein 16-like n=1 Tax=Eucyclogobius newberryi TaxID=166745 RepID=UPI003B5A6914